MKGIKSASDLASIFLAHEAEFRRMAESIDSAEGLQWIAKDESELSGDKRLYMKRTDEFYFQSIEPLSTEVYADLEKSASLLWESVIIDKTTVRKNSQFTKFYYASDFAQSAVIYYSASGEEPNESYILEKFKIDSNWYAVILG